MKLPFLASIASDAPPGSSAIRNWRKRRSSAARAIFERTTREQPDYPQAWAYLGLTDAMLGRCSEAIQEGKRACEILPYTKDSWVGPTFMTYLACDLCRVRRKRGGAATTQNVSRTSGRR